jgi:formylglycine-generating enzyme required for sulfatase activity
MARAAGMTATASGLADVVRLWAQALQRNPECAELPDGWLRALRDDGDAVTHRFTMQLSRHDLLSRELPRLQPPEALEAPVVVTSQPGRLKAPVLAVVAADFQPDAAAPEVEQPIELLSSLEPDEYAPLQPLSHAPWLPLAARSRWWAVLRQFSPRVLAGPDLPGLVDRCARAQLLQRLPRLQRRGQFRRMLVLRDARKCMRPHWRDFQTILAQLRAQPVATDLREQPFHGLPPHVPPDVDAVLLLSDLGLAGASDVGTIAAPWASWARTLALRGVSVQAWLPISTHTIPSALAKEMDCIPWHERSRFRPCRGVAAPNAVKASMSSAQTWMSELWSRLAIAQRVEPALLRRARLLVGGAGCPEWDTLFWQDTSEHRAGEQVLQFHSESVAYWRKQFAGLSAHEQLQVWEMFWAQHASLPRSTLVIELLIWRAYARSEALAAVAGALQAFEEWLRRLAAQEARHAASNGETLCVGEDRAIHSGFLHGLIQRNSADPQFTAIHAESYARLALAIDRLGDGAGVPAEVWLRAMQRVDGARDSLAFSIQLHHRPEGVFIERWREESSQSLASSSLSLPVARRVLLPQVQRHSELWQPEGAAVRRLNAQQPASPGMLHAKDALGSHALELGRLHRASWQQALGQDRYGVFCEVNVKQICLRFRYIPPGTFLQGSPEGIGDADEHPRHLVTLTQGFWLAETPCTQELWQAVIGNNPSGFKQGDDASRRPVENVSWYQVMAFLRRLQSLLPPSCEAVLPTESQWEYACRAGTQSEYWWGDAPDDTRASWNGKHRGTTPVGLYPPNPWGLYDMHGNVWEWCRDGQRYYVPEPALDRMGSITGDVRVVRGGSWAHHLRLARAAYRYWWPSGHASQFQGFRVALLSVLERESPPVVSFRRSHGVGELPV